MSDLPRISSLPRVERCPTSHILMQTQDLTSDNEAGTIKHAYLAGVVNVGPDAALALVPEAYKEACAAIPLERVFPNGTDGLRAEVSVRWDHVTNKGRFSSEEPRPTEVPGSADVVVPLFAGMPEVWDYKTGWRNVDEVKTNLQVGAYALAVARAYDADEVRARIKYLRGSWVQEDAVVFDGWDLETITERILAVKDQVRKARQMMEDFRAKRPGSDHPPVVTGRQCDYCPAVLYCPASKALTHVMSGGSGDLELELDRMITPENAGRALDYLKTIKALTGRIEGRIRAIAANHTLTLADGKSFGWYERTVRTWDGKAVYGALRDDPRFGQERALIGAEISATAASVERAIVAAKQAGLVGPKEGKKVFREIADKLRSSGGLIEEKKEALGEFWPDEPDDEGNG